MDGLLTAVCGGAVGYLLGTLDTRRASMWVQGYMMVIAQLAAVRMENQSLRRRGKRPSMPAHRKWIFGMAYRFCPVALAATGFSPQTLVRWHRDFCKSYAWVISMKGKWSNAGRPRVDADLEGLILEVKADHPKYGPTRIAQTLRWQSGIAVSPSTVWNVLQRNWWRPRGGGLLKLWQTFLKNHFHEMASFDFTIVPTLFGQSMYVLNIIDHRTRELLLSRATMNPTYAWIDQQLREAFPFDQAPKYCLMDNDQLFVRAAERTLPSMGVRVLHTSFGCPWQNPYIERFNQTLKRELLNYVIVRDEDHANRLLRQFRTFYNHHRPHQANANGHPPCRDRGADNADHFDPIPSGIRKRKRCGGLHYTYERAA
jgi:transposase InsO family protein